MTEPENFEDDLFDDLYNDDAPTRTAAASAPEPDAPVAEPAEHSNTNYNNNANDNDDHHDTSYAADHDIGDDSHMNGAEEYEEDDDDVDFNLGNGDSHAPDTPSYNNAPAQPMHRGPNAKEDGKMFIGGLNWETTDESLRDYFSQFGEVTECTVMRDGATGRSRGFGFLTFKDPKTVNVVMVKEHYLDGKIIDPKRAIPRDEQEKTSKIFVGGVSQETTDAEFREYFAQFGRVVDATLMMDKDTGRPRGFGFVTFESEAGVEACLATDLEIHGKPIEVKKAQPRGNMREEEEANRRGGKFGKGRGAGNNMDESSSQGGGMGGGGPGGITPQAMAQQWSRMQQMFQMWQQQMAMNRGMAGGPMGMNPQAAMMQMMQMQQMQQQMMMQAQGGGAGRGAGGPMGNMNPQMMQQMMNQMGAQMGTQMGGPPQGPGSPAGPQGAMQQQIPGGPAAAAGGNQARPAYNAFEQQAFEQQKYDQRGRRDNFAGPQAGQAYGMGGGAGGPTSWEGMYDDVPQPNIPNQMGGGMAGGMGVGRGGGFHRGRGAGGFHQNQQQQQQQQSGPVDPSKAPPANAPTGPKNAGRPGANYRGGGRGGGTRGFHPYGR
ncbi:hypothetical protein VP1G_10023 [Cytospora mali]|uniref:RRM domain-containing protein n=1 Tax=Cytospora mali TaxID=578113 RepID=A0A194VGB0_CYTMA|nr:hypothetical protein VP1G_10023 [Valsa mali var. pyri (nom. inval.)]